MNKELIEKRKQTKSKKPDFFMQDSHKKDKLKNKWRKPRGIDSKVRLGLKGYRRKPSKGYRSPKEIRGIHGKGYKIYHVENVKDLEDEKFKDINKEEDAIIIKSSVGQKKKIEIIKKANELDIKVLNYKDQKEYIKQKEDMIEKKKEEKKKKIEEKDKKLKDKEKKVKEASDQKKEDKLAEKLSEEEKKEKEKKEIDKVLTKKE